MNQRAEAEHRRRVYLYVDQLAELTPWSADRIRHMIVDRTFLEGVHYFRPGGRRPIFLWPAVVQYIEGRNQQPIQQDEDMEVLDDETRQARALLN